MLEKINTDIITAMREKDTLRLATLRMLKGAVELERINKRVEKLTDEEIISITEKQIKIRKESIIEFEHGNRLDLVDKTEEEIGILNEYMPEALTDDEVNSIITDAINEVNATSIKDMGNVMKIISPKLRGKADMSLVSGILKSKLN